MQERNQSAKMVTVFLLLHTIGFTTYCIYTIRQVQNTKTLSNQTVPVHHIRILTTHVYPLSHIKCSLVKAYSCLGLSANVFDNLYKYKTL